MKNSNYLIMAAIASGFSILGAYLCNVVDFLNGTNESTMFIVFAVFAIGIAIQFSQEYLTKKDISASRKAVRIAITALLLLVLMIVIFYLAVFMVLAYGQ